MNNHTKMRYWRIPHIYTGRRTSGGHCRAAKGGQMADQKQLRAKTTRSRYGRRSLSALVASLITGGVLLTSSTGCTAFSAASQKLKRNDCIDDFVIGYRNQALAAKAWHAQKHCFANQPHTRHFEAGFRSGYEDVASGSDGCTPSIAPQEYWGWRYQSPEGQAKVAAWFAGYPLGAKAAEQDGLAHWSEIPTMFSKPAEQPTEPPVEAPEPELPQPPPQGVPVMIQQTTFDMAPTPAVPYQPATTRSLAAPPAGSGNVPFPSYPFNASK
ncbi:hypothetical protein FF011L_55330 [Roseimaritima multifibrata]|uniref:Uncharacterized protein n=1 Tax=Roseimaritima multifibrata TaxID=1930274 RepID=A0A517MPB5_9BACT|nr:hypothetical protein [Roseimaritima multifibrata]QDS96721.1 hypothetical protein FF011L_55330 [Roseimaritima multifibrata]